MKGYDFKNICRALPVNSFIKADPIVIDKKKP